MRIVSKHRDASQSHLSATAKVMRNIICEFGPAEFFDSFIVRPFFMYLMQRLTGSLAVGIFAGKICADATFYAITIFFY